MADKIQNAYEASKNIYDDVLTQGNFFSRMYIKLFWSGTDDNAIARKVLSYIPNDFSGALLDVPVGTAVFTQRKWTALKNARITCLDYSTDMLEQAEKRLNGQAHIRCVQGDVGNLPMADESFDIVVSMNGFHAFPDKQKAFGETWRVLKPGGTFLICNECGGAPGGARWEQVVSGMHVYAPEELHTVLERSGFQTMQVFENKQGWLCVIARKEGKLQ